MVCCTVPVCTLIVHSFLRSYFVQYSTHKSLALDLPVFVESCAVLYKWTKRFNVLDHIEWDDLNQAAVKWETTAAGRPADDALPYRHQPQAILISQKIIPTYCQERYWCVCYTRGQKSWIAQSRWWSLIKALGGRCKIIERYLATMKATGMYWRWLS